MSRMARMAITVRRANQANPQPVRKWPARELDGSGTTIRFHAKRRRHEFGRIGEAHLPTAFPNRSAATTRAPSNLVVGAGDAGVANPEGVSAFMYAWGQFIDHDMTLTRSDNVHHIDIVVPAGDPILPDGTVISMTRAVIDPTTGAGTSNPAMAVNSTPAGSTPRWSMAGTPRSPQTCGSPTAT